jgi:DNA-binding transcriptional MerR regulator
LFPQVSGSVPEKSFALLLTLTLRQAVRSWKKGGSTLKQRIYRIGQFAKKASVTVRALRFYDKVGLLSPLQQTGAGYRLYCEEDLLTLQQILALKFLGFSLEEIKHCLQRGPKSLPAILAQQRAMMQEKRAQLDVVIDALARTEALLGAGVCDWQSLVNVIQEIQMDQKTEWVRKYFTEEQLRTMYELTWASYSEEALEKLKQPGAWTEEDQKRATAQWQHVASEAKRLAASGADPGGEEAQAVARLKCELLAVVTQGDPEVAAGLAKWWENFRAMPEQQRPFDASPFDAGDEGKQLLEKAMAIYKERQAQSPGA